MHCVECLRAHDCWPAQVGAANITVRREPCIAPGQTLVAQGATCSDLYVVVKGCCKITDSHRDGSERVVAFALPGDIIGLEALPNRRYPYRVEALEETVVCRIKWSSEQPPPPNALLHLLSKAGRQLAISNSGPRALATSHQRVAQFLLDFSQRRGGTADGADLLNLPMTRADIGSFLGLAEETVVRAVKKIKSQSCRNCTPAATR